MNKQLLKQKIAEINANLDVIKDKFFEIKKQDLYAITFKRDVLVKQLDGSEDVAALEKLKSNLEIILTKVIPNTPKGKDLAQYFQAVQHDLTDITEDIRQEKINTQLKPIVKGVLEAKDEVDQLRGEFQDFKDQYEAEQSKKTTNSGNQDGTVQPVQAAVNTNGEPLQTTNTDKEPESGLPGDPTKKNKKWKVIKAIILGSLVAAAAGGIGFGIGKAINSQSQKPQPEPPQPVNVSVSVDISNSTNIQNNYSQDGKPAEDGAKPPVEEPTNNPPPQGPETITPPTPTTDTIKPPKTTPKQDDLEKAIENLNKMMEQKKVPTIKIGNGNYDNQEVINNALQEFVDSYPDEFKR